MEMRMNVPFFRTPRRRVPTIAAAIVVSLILGGVVVASTITANAATTLLSQGRPATASSTENAGTPASAAVDGKCDTPGTEQRQANFSREPASNDETGAGGNC